MQENKAQTIRCPKCKALINPAEVSLSRRNSKVKLGCGHTVSYGQNPVWVNKIKAEGK